MHWRLAFLYALLSVAGTAAAVEPVPNGVVVLTFDDAVQSHFHIARPLLKKYGFGATFFVSEGFEFRTDKKNYLTWQQIAQLHHDGFEIGNHTRDHMAVTAENVEQLSDNWPPLKLSAKSTASQNLLHSHIRATPSLPKRGRFFVSTAFSLPAAVELPNIPTSKVRASPTSQGLIIHC